MLVVVMLVVVVEMVLEQYFNFRHAWNIDIFSINSELFDTKWKSFTEKTQNILDIFFGGRGVS